MKRTRVLVAVFAIVMLAGATTYAQMGLIAVLTPQGQVAGANELLRDTILSVVEDAAAQFGMDINTKNLVLVSRGDLTLIGVGASAPESLAEPSAASTQLTDIGLVYVSHAATIRADDNATDPGAVSSSAEEHVPAGFYAFRLAIDGSSKEMIVYDDLGQIVVRFPISVDLTAHSSEVAASLDSAPNGDGTVGCVTWYGPRFAVGVSMTFAP
jgi:hypothetical protein